MADIKLVGPHAARLGALAEQADDLGDRVGPRHITAANYAYGVARLLRERAGEEADRWRQDHTHA